MIDDKYKTVTEVNNYIKYLLDNNSNLANIFLKGEISNFKNHSRGHLYFTLKDDSSRINAVMFQSYANNLKFVPEDGMKVLINGRITAYPASGNYQIYVNEMVLDGLGNLYLEFEKLKEKLNKEGLFKKEQKKTIPLYPNKIGVITAPTGAAIKDIISTIKRRYPICEIVLFPTLVQGPEAASNIVKQIETADTFACDTLIVGRGGGSIEDLWAFNEEIVARAIYNAKTPIISAVGHEPDFTIADFAADLRAPTPTGAAEMAVPTVRDINNLLNQLKIRSTKTIKSIVNNSFINLYNLKNSYILKNPKSLYELKEQQIDKIIDDIHNSTIKIILNKKSAIDEMKTKIVQHNPINRLKVCQSKINELKINSINNMDKRLLLLKSNLEYMINSLKLTNPLNVLQKGYSIVKKDNIIVKDKNSLRIGDNITINLHEGIINAKVTKIKEEK